MPRLEDKQLKCRNCHDDFLWSAGEQEFFQERGLTTSPPAANVVARKTARQPRCSAHPGHDDHSSASATTLPAVAGEASFHLGCNIAALSVHLLPVRTQFAGSVPASASGS